MYNFHIWNLAKTHLVYKQLFFHACHSHTMSCRKLLPKFHVDLDEPAEKHQVPITQFCSKSKIKNEERKRISKLSNTKKQSKL